MTEQTCKSCVFVAGKLSEYRDLDDLRCRRYPPQASGGKWGDTFAQPKVRRYGWCGEWAAKPQQEEREA